jgi:hypothetical protein
LWCPRDALSSGETLKDRRQSIERLPHRQADRAPAADRPCPSGSERGAKTVDAQAAYEAVQTMWPVLLAGTNYVMHSAGWMEAGLARPRSSCLSWPTTTASSNGRRTAPRTPPPARSRPPVACSTPTSPLRSIPRSTKPSRPSFASARRCYRTAWSSGSIGRRQHTETVLEPVALAVQFSPSRSDLPRRSFPPDKVRLRFLRALRVFLPFSRSILAP